MMKPWSIALLIAQPPMPKIITYIQKLRTKSSEATGFNDPAGIFYCTEFNGFMPGKKRKTKEKKAVIGRGKED